MADNSGNFWGGFLFGAAVGGVVGALVAIKLSEPESELIEQPSGRDRLIDQPQTSNEFARRKSLNLTLRSIQLVKNWLRLKEKMVVNKHLLNHYEI